LCNSAAMLSISKQSEVSGARRCVLKTDHGELQTPFFMTIATKGAVKTMPPDDLKRIGVPIVLANTYHLLCRPGLDLMRSRGGLHKWMNWDGPMLTDSGGYQVFSLGNMRKVSEDAVTFQSHIDGRKIVLTPELSIEMQQAIGADIIMQLDVVLPPNSEKVKIKKAMEQSIRWAERCKAASNDPKHKLFGIVQGGIYEDLRKESLERLIALDLDGYAIGGLSVGESREDNQRVAAFVADQLPEGKPRYFMGGGMPEEIVAYVKMGIDMFDCVIPTRHARHGSLFIYKEGDQLSQDGSFYENLNITNSGNINDDNPVDSTCDCTLCTQFSRSYLHHLFSMNEVLGARLATEHNVRFYMRLMDTIRMSIENGQF
jgi:queuine tRNA-ribosyltransferase